MPTCTNKWGPQQRLMPPWQVVESVDSEEPRKRGNEDRRLSAARAGPHRGTQNVGKTLPSSSFLVVLTRIFELSFIAHQYCQRPSGWAVACI